MRDTIGRLARWVAVACVGAAVAACGGGGGGGGTSGTGGTGATGDARNGDYTMIAANAREYTLSLDFDADTYHVVGNGVDQAGAIAADGTGFDFLPGNATGATGVTTTRFSVATDTIVGEFVLPEGTLPFVAPRNFITTVAGAAGTYNLLGRTVDTGGAAPNTTIQQGMVSTDGHLYTCDDPGLYEISNCPSGSITTGTLTVSGNTFTSQTANGNILFHVAQVGTDKVFLRASASGATTRRFIVGTPATSSFTAATFGGGTTEPAWGSADLSATAYSSTGTSPTGVTTTHTGTATATGANTLASLLLVNTGDVGNLFAVRSSELGIVVAARGNSLAPGFEAIGVKQ